MNQAQIDELRTECRRVAGEAMNVQVQDTEIGEFLNGVLFTDKDLWWALSSRLLTAAEVSNAIADRYYAFLLERRGLPFVPPEQRDVWNTFASRLAAILERAQSAAPST